MSDTGNQPPNQPNRPNPAVPQPREQPQGISLAEQAEAAGRPRQSDIRQGTDDIDALRRKLFDFCTSQGAPTAALSSARTKFEEAIFWLRHHRNNPGG